MHTSRKSALILVLLLISLVLAAAPRFAAAQQPAPHWQFQIQLSPEASKKTFSGRLYLLFGPLDQPPRKAFDWFKLPPMFSVDITEMKPGQTYALTSEMKGVKVYPPHLTPDLFNQRSVQVIARLAPLEPDIFEGPGNAVSFPQAVQLTVEGSLGTATPLIVDRVLPPPKIDDDPLRKILTIKSPLLSKFHNRDVSLQATVNLPESYLDSGTRQYPVVYDIPGFGGNHLSESPLGAVIDRDEPGAEFIRVMLNPQCPLGHSAFADSANNGPVGRALVEDFIPPFEKEYRALPAPHGRLLTGHSSGGWSVLWLQITHPKFFGGAWSYAPDPVDFRNFQQIDLYSPGANMFTDPQGNRRPIARENGRPVVWYDNFSQMEEVYGPGQQLHSFEAVFSPRLPNGNPAPLWDRKTGKVDPTIADAWKKYDVHLKLTQEWPTLKQDLAGKLHIFVGDEDSFYLEGSVRLLKKTLEELGSDAVVEIVPGKDHDDILSPDLLRRNRAEMVQAVNRSWPAAKTR